MSIIWRVEAIRQYRLVGFIINAATSKNNPCQLNTGESPSGKAAAFGAAIRRFESSLPSQDIGLRFLVQGSGVDSEL